MTPQDRYLRTLAFWVPPTRRKPILEDVRGIILDRLDAAAAAAGHALSEAEARAELRAFGRPALIAANYLARRAVISAPLAVFYWRVLKIVTLVILAAQIIVLVAQRSDDVGLLVTQAGGRAIEALLIGFTSVTVSFMMLDRFSAGRR